MAAYILVNVKVTDPERYATYRQLAQDAIAHHGGRYLARGGETAVLEGEWTPDRVIVLEFPTLDAAKKFYDSPEYLAARAARGGAATMSMVAVAGA